MSGNNLRGIQPITTSKISEDILREIFNSEKNPIACANYGGGTHCDNETRTQKKISLWGARSETLPEDSCMAAKIFFIDSEPAGLFNIGRTGALPTVIDRAGNGAVYEFSGLLVTDKFINSKVNEIGARVHDFMQNCNADEGYTKAIVTFSTDHPYQYKFLSAAGGIEVNASNVEALLGNNSLHPERFAIEDGHVKECAKWNQEADKVAHDGWHDSHPCVEWQDKTMMLFGINSYGHFDTQEL